METNWIKVEDRLPEENVFVISYGRFVPLFGIMETGMDHFFVAKIKNGSWIDNISSEEIENEDFRMTHWMPLPNTPE